MITKIADITYLVVGLSPMLFNNAKFPKQAFEENAGLILLDD